MKKKFSPWFIFWQALAGILMVMFLILSIPYGQQKLFDDLLSAGFPNEREGWACGRSGTILHTTDGGMRWIRQNSGTEAIKYEGLAPKVIRIGDCVQPTKIFHAFRESWIALFQF
jgi:hypothetical protein